MMGAILISLMAGGFGSYLAYKAIGADRLWEMIIAIIVGGIFGYTASMFILGTAASLLMGSAHSTESERTEIPIEAFTSQVTSATYATSESEDGTVTTIRPARGATSRYTYVDKLTGEVKEVPSRNSVVMVSDNYEDTLIIVNDKFKEGTFAWFMFGTNETTRENIFHLSTLPQKEEIGDGG